jgi:hypothetical protein
MRCRRRPYQLLYLRDMINNSASSSMTLKNNFTIADATAAVN